MGGLYTSTCHVNNVLSLLPYAVLLVGDWLRLLPFFGAVGGMGYLAYKQVKYRKCVNLCVQKSKDKVVDFCDIEDITGDKVCYCRCWKSKKVNFICICGVLS